MQNTCRKAPSARLGNTSHLPPNPLPRHLPCILLLCAASASAIAEPSRQEGLFWDASQHFTHDDNLFRLPEGQTSSVPGFPTQRADTLSTTRVMAGFERRYSLQKIHLDAEVRRNAFETFDYLDHTTTNLHGHWDWAVGKLFSGRLQASQDESLRGFADFAYTTKSINTFRRIGADGYYWFHPQWSAGLGLVRVSSQYSDAQSASSEYDENAAEIVVSYRPQGDNLLSGVLRQADGKYPGRPTGGLYPSEYRQRDVRLRGEWAITGLSRLQGYLGYTQRKYPDFSSRNFDGITGRLNYGWQTTPKLLLSAGLRRELGAQEDLTDNYVVTSALSLAAHWNLAALFAVGGRYEHRYRDYGGDPGLGIAPTVGRDDRTDFVDLYIDYLPLSWLSIRLSVARESRNADNSSADYNDTLTTLSATARF